MEHIYAKVAPGTYWRVFWDLNDPADWFFAKAWEYSAHLMYTRLNTNGRVVAVNH